MKKEELITPAELNALLAENEKISEELDHDESPRGQDLNSLQNAVTLLTKQVEELQLQLHEQFELQNRQLEQFLRLCRHQLENKLHEQLVNTIVVHQQASNHDEKLELQNTSHALIAPEEVNLRIANKVETTELDTQMPLSRVKSYSKIRKRKKGFLEKLFE